MSRLPAAGVLVAALLLAALAAADDKPKPKKVDGFYDEVVTIVAFDRRGKEVGRYEGVNAVRRDVKGETRFHLRFRDVHATPLGPGAHVIDAKGVAYRVKSITSVTGGSHRREIATVEKLPKKP